MITAPIPENETARLNKLISYNILDTDAEDIFDEVTKTAAAICDAKISLISLIDNHRQWFKAKHGLDANETPRDISYCGHTILSDELMIVEDAADDERFCDNPLHLEAPHVKFYAGAPLITPEGYRIGTLCVIDPEKKILLPHQILALKSLSKQVINYLELKRSNLEFLSLKNTYDSQNIKFKRVLTNMLEGLIVQASDGSIITHNPAALKILRVTEQQLMNRKVMVPHWQSIREDGVPFSQQEHPAHIALTFKKTVRNVVMGLTDGYNETRWISINATPVETDEGINSITTFTDITESRKLEEETRFILNSMQVGTWRYDIENDALDWDDINYSLFKADRNDFSGAKQAWESRLHPNSKTNALKDFNNALEGKAEFNTTFEINTPDSVQCFLGGRGEVFRDQAGKPIRMVGINWDKTREHIDSIELEKQKKLAQHHTKLASIGELAAGVGHEINNPLAIAKGLLESLNKKLPANDAATINTFSTVNNALDRIAAIVKGLRTFSRIDDDDTDHFDVIETLDESIALVEDIYKIEGITLRNNSDLKKNNVGINGSRGKLQQTFMNLLSNAKDAVRETPLKTITIDTELHSNNLKIIITDSGCGIPNNIIDHIFDPFFTTKDVNEGTGIGLSLVYNFVKELGGTITVNSNENVGTSFIIEFSIIEYLKNNDVNEAHNHDAAPTIKSSVILADDEEGIRDVLAMIIEEMGIKVTKAENGQQALDIYMNAPEAFDIIISDIQMPEMDGVTLLKTIRGNKELKQPKFIFITGGINIDLEASDNELNQLIDGHFFKPFDQKNVFETLKVLTS
jgi:PAS domain S-box-containing protein